MVAGPSASVVIPAHDAGATIAMQLEALAAQVGAPSFEVVVVANRCKDDTVDVARRFQDGLDIHIEIADDQPGVSYARNYGVAVACADLILHCDADDRVGSSWVEAMVEALDAFDIVGGPARLPKDTPCWYASPFLYDVDHLYESRGVRFALGGCIGYRRNVHQAVGGFDERLIGGAEEIAFCLHAKRSGHRLGFAPRAEIEYFPRATARDTLKQRFRWGQGEATLRVFHQQEGLRPLPLELASASRALAVTALRATRPSRSRAAAVRAAALVGRTTRFVGLARNGDWPQAARYRAWTELRRPPGANTRLRRHR